MIYWIYLLIASFLETGWMLSLKYISFSALKNLSFQSAGWKGSALVIAPFIGYVVFGIGNIYCFSVATKHIPVSIAFAIWMGVALCSIKVIEIVFYKQTGSFMEYVFMAMLLVAIIGLKSGKP